MGRAHAILPAHLADHELGVATDQIGPFRTSFAVEIPQVPQQKDQTVVLRAVLAAHWTVACLQVPYVTNEFLVSDHEGGFHESLLGQLHASASASEQADRLRPP